MIPILLLSIETRDYYERDCTRIKKGGAGIKGGSMITIAIKTQPWSRKLTTQVYREIKSTIANDKHL